MKGAMIKTKKNCTEINAHENELINIRYCDSFKYNKATDMSISQAASNPTIS